MAQQGLQDGRESYQRKRVTSSENTSLKKKQENETGSVKIRCVGSSSVKAFDIFSQGRDPESCGGLSWEEPFGDARGPVWIVSLRLGWMCLWCLM